MNVAIYCRVSTQNQAEDELSIPGQVEECRKYANERGWTVVKVYPDAGISGRTDERPGLQEMYLHAKEKPRPFDIILVWRGNRFFRNAEHRLAYSRLLKRYGIRFISLHEPELEGSTGRLMEAMLGAIDEFYSQQCAEDTLRGLKQIARQGFSTGGRPPTGYRNIRKAAGIRPNGEPIMRTSWEPDPEMSLKVRRAFEMCAAGSTNVEIVQATHIVSAKNGLSTLLRNRAYLGERVYNTTRKSDKKSIRIKNNPEEYIVTPNAHPALISQEIFNQVQNILDRKKPNRVGRSCNYQERLYPLRAPMVQGTRRAVFWSHHVDN